MDNQTALLIAIICGVIILGVYRKSKFVDKLRNKEIGKKQTNDSDDTELLLSNNMLLEGGADAGTKRQKRVNNAGVTRLRMARILHALEANLPDGDSIVQVYDYKAIPGGEGGQYTIDVMLFNSATTQSKTKRITCSADGAVMEEFDISPVTGEVVRYKSNDDILGEIISSDDDGSVTGAKFVRDKYAFINNSDYNLPPEPERPPTNNPADMRVYRKAMALYEKHVQQVRNKNALTQRKIAFVPTLNEPINPHLFFPTTCRNPTGLVQLKKHLNLWIIVNSLT